MSMIRAQLAGAMWGRLQQQFVEAGISNEDTTGNLKEPVDETLIALGVGYEDLETATVETVDEAKALILARYYGLLTVYDAVMNRTDTQISTGAPSVSKSESKSQYVRQLENALFRARENAEPFLPSTTGSSWSVDDLTLGIYSMTEDCL
jgi:hypothetical protein